MPCAASITHASQCGSISIFFNSPIESDKIYGLTCSHILNQTQAARNIYFRIKGSRANPIIGTIDKIYNYNTNLDLGIIHFSKKTFNKNFKTYSVQPTENPSRIIEVIGLRNKPFKAHLLESAAELQHEKNLFKNLFVFKKFGQRGDSGSSIFTIKNKEISCIGLVSIIKNQKTYVNSLHSIHELLKKDYSISNFLYISKDQSI